MRRRRCRCCCCCLGETADCCRQFRRRSSAVAGRVPHRCRSRSRCRCRTRTTRARHRPRARPRCSRSPTLRPRPSPHRRLRLRRRPARPRRARSPVATRAPARRAWAIRPPAETRMSARWEVARPPALAAPPSAPGRLFADAGPRSTRRARPSAPRSVSRAVRAVGRAWSESRSVLGCRVHRRGRSGEMTARSSAGRPRPRSGEHVQMHRARPRVAGRRAEPPRSSPLPSSRLRRHHSRGRSGSPGRPTGAERTREARGGHRGGSRRLRAAPRWMSAATEARETPSSAPISSYDKPCSSRRRSASRCDSGSSRNAAARPLTSSEEVDASTLALSESSVVATRALRARKRLMHTLSAIVISHGSGCRISAPSRSASHARRNVS